jgi:hypothetical protein
VASCKVHPQSCSPILTQTASAACLHPDQVQQLFRLSPTIPSLLHTANPGQSHPSIFHPTALSDDQHITIQARPNSAIRTRVQVQLQCASEESLLSTIHLFLAPPLAHHVRVWLLTVCLPNGVNTFASQSKGACFLKANYVTVR